MRVHNDGLCTPFICYPAGTPDEPSKRRLLGPEQGPPGRPALPKVLEVAGGQGTSLRALTASLPPPRPTGSLCGQTLPASQLQLGEPTAPPRTALKETQVLGVCAEMGPRATRTGYPYGT